LYTTKLKWQNGKIVQSFEKEGEEAVQTRTILCMVYMGVELGLRVIGIGVRRTTYGPRMDDVTGEWGRLNNEDFHNLYCWPNIVRVII
jgi:hypothetical protein